MTLAESLIRATNAEQVLENEPMAKYTTFRVGGPAEVLFHPKTAEEIRIAVKLAKDFCAPLTVIGNGSNLLVRDGGIPGLVIRLQENFSGISVQGERITACAGELLSRVSACAKRASLTGLEFASGIPGSLGGAAAMNAGAYGGQMSDVVISAVVMDLETGETAAYSLEDLEMGYRTSRPLREKKLVLSCEMLLKRGDIAEISARMEDLNQRRREKQPLSMPSAGSTFKRPEGYFAGALIEQAGLKGAAIGGAQVSELHAGFIVNRGGAAAKDIFQLIEYVQKRVLEMSGVKLEPEVRILGVDKIGGGEA